MDDERPERVSRSMEPVKALALVAVWERAAEDLQRMLRSLEGIDEAVEACTNFRR